jgi:hypothetical protein
MHCAANRDFACRTAHNWFTAVNWLTSGPEQLAPRQAGRQSSGGLITIAPTGLRVLLTYGPPRSRRRGRAHPRHAGRAGSPSLSRRSSSPPDRIVSSDRAGARLGGRTVGRRVGGVGDDRALDAPTRATASASGTPRTPRLPVAPIMRASSRRRGRPVGCSGWDMTDCIPLPDNKPAFDRRWTTAACAAARRVGASAEG